jgi:hypothetical protein
MEKVMKRRAPGQWRFVGNSWQHTTVYSQDDAPVCRLDLEDWDVTEDNQDELEAEQERVARLIVAAPEMRDLLVRILDSFPGYIPDFVEPIAKLLARTNGQGADTK